MKNNIPVAIPEKEGGENMRAVKTQGPYRFRTTYMASDLFHIPKNPEGSISPSLSQKEDVIKVPVISNVFRE
jgi:hypothetical protein